MAYALLTDVNATNIGEEMIAVSTKEQSVMELCYKTSQ
jgi:hypothetical protein